MTEKILAYFRTENDAESARSALNTLKVSNLYVDSIPESFEDTRYIPITPLGPTWGVNGGIVNLEKVDMETDQVNSDSPVTYLIEGQVEEEDLEKAKLILQENNAYESEK